MLKTDNRSTYAAKGVPLSSPDDQALALEQGDRCISHAPCERLQPAIELCSRLRLCARGDRSMVDEHASQDATTDSNEPDSE